MAGQIHPMQVEVAAAAAAGEQLPEGDRLNGLPIIAGTWRSLLLRAMQFVASGVALGVLVSSADLRSLQLLR